MASIVATMTTPAQVAASQPSVSRDSSVSLSVTALTSNPKTWSLVIGRKNSGGNPATINDLTLRQVWLVPDTDQPSIRKTGSQWHVDITQDVGALTTASVADNFWVCLVAGDPTVTTTPLDLVTGPFATVA